MTTDHRSISPLRAARHARKLSLEQVAVAAGISSAWLRQLERDPSLLSARIAERLLPILGLRLENIQLPRQEPQP